MNVHLADRLKPTASRALPAKVLDGLSGYALLGWAYIAANSIAHPATLNLGLTHFASWPHERTFGIACFALSGVLYLAARVAQAGSRL
jgi:hypothetical protein